MNAKIRTLANIANELSLQFMYLLNAEASLVL